VSAAGNNGQFYCADGYDLSGVIVGNKTFPGATRREVATYCADYCSASPSCHAIVVSGTNCLMKGRNASSMFYDVLRTNSTLGCFKYAMLWDLLGGTIAVQTGVASDASTRFRCMRSQDIQRIDLQVRG
jgi:hypothetical protein